MADLSDSEEEVKHKPNIGQNGTLPTEPTEISNRENFDILLIGHAGYGKSSTADKLMVPNSQESLDGQVSKAQEFQASLSQSSSQRHDLTYQAIEGPQIHMQISSDDDKNKIEEYAGGPYCEGEHRELKIATENLTGCVLSDNHEEMNNAELRLKNIVFCRETRNEDEPHIQIRKLRNHPEHKTIYSSTKSCQLLTNEDSKMRVLDTPGFFSKKKGASNNQENNLAIVRQIVRIQAMADLKFNRVLYFLPVKGKLTREDGIINEEIRELIKFFGRSIFESMVLVATTVENFSCLSDIKNGEKFPPEDLAESQENFRLVLEAECPRHNVDIEGLLTPPIIFIAMTDTCEEILHKIKQAPVHDDTGPQLVFNPNHCIKCGMEFVVKDGEQLICEYKGEGSLKWTNAIAYKDTKCHPQIQPVYTAKSVLKGFVGLFRLEWKFSEERCVNSQCKLGPGTEGCMNVGSQYLLEGEDGTTVIIVNHSSKLN